MIQKSFWTNPEAEAQAWADKVRKKDIVDLTPILNSQKKSKII